MVCSICYYDLGLQQVPEYLKKIYHFYYTMEGKIGRQQIIHIQIVNYLESDL
jgi:hypothetical protein